MSNSHKIIVTRNDLQYCIFAITKKCNLRCRWCFENSDGNVKEKELSTEEIIGVVKKLRGLKSIGISGGEASLHPDIFKILAETKNVCKNPRLLSNGVAISDGLLKFLKNNEIKLTVSIDGIDKKHDAIRGKGTFGKVINTIKNAVNYGINVSIQCTLSKYNLSDVKKLVSLADNLNVNYISFMRMKPLGRGVEFEDEALSSTEVRSVIRRINNLKKQARTKIIFKDPLDNTFNHDLKRFAISSNCVAGGCRAGVESIYIEYNGDIFPCPFLRCKIGNAVKDDPLTIFEKSDILEKIRLQSNYNKCSKCDNWLICRGCRAEPFLRDGNFLGNDVGCWQ